MHEAVDHEEAGRATRRGDAGGEAPRAGQDVPPGVEQHQEREGQEERRSGGPRQHQEARHACPAPGGGNPQQPAEHGGDDRRRSGELEGGGQEGAQIRHHGAAGVQRFGEVARRRPPQEPQVLHGQWLVEPELVALGGDRLLRGRGSHHRPDGVGGDHGLEGEHDGGECQQDDGEGREPGRHEPCHQDLPRVPSRRAQG